MYLYESLEKYAKSDYYPFHMPGHKRNNTMNFMNPYAFDITEIDGFDNLHHSEGILREAQKRASIVYGSAESYFLINGTTAGLLSAISACTSKGGTIIMGRNCHKAVYHAVFLQELRNIYTYPHNTGKYCVNGGLNAENIKQLLINNKNVQAVIITSPSYDGIVSDVKEIAKVVHEFRIPLIVDEAHGAHFGFHPYFPNHSNHKDADIVVHSVHKTLPSLTQTAIIHVNGTLVDKEKLKRYLSIFQTSSPSYVLMASIDSCIRLVQDCGNELFKAYTARLSDFRMKMKELKHLQLMGEELIGSYDIYDYDRSKLIISTKDTNITGKELYHQLLDKYRLQMEMVAGDYILGMTSIMDTKEGLDRLEKALFEIDKELYLSSTNNPRIHFHMEAKVCYTISEAVHKEYKACELSQAIGFVSAEYVYLYPPGIPLIAPGEEITEKFISCLFDYIKMGLNVEGMKDHTLKTIQVIKEDKLSNDKVNVR